MPENPKYRQDQRQLGVLRQIRQMEAGALVWFDRPTAQECVDRGWAAAGTGGRYSLTEAGRQILATAESNAGEVVRGE